MLGRDVPLEPLGLSALLHDRKNHGYWGPILALGQGITSFPIDQIFPLAKRGRTWQLFEKFVAVLALSIWSLLHMPIV